MEDIPTWIPVVALALYDSRGRLLLQQRPADKHHGGMWEFPGGKVETDEIPRDALCREIAEELSIKLEPAALLPALIADESEISRVVLLLYKGSQWEGEVIPMEQQEWGWFTRDEARQLDLAPMDADLLERLGD